MSMHCWNYYFSNNSTDDLFFQKVWTAFIVENLIEKGLGIFNPCDLYTMKIRMYWLQYFWVFPVTLCVSVFTSVSSPADCVFTGAGWCSQETEAGLQAGAGGGLHECGELRAALPRAHWEETPSETEPCLSEDLSPSFSSCDFLPPPFKDDFFLDLFSASSSLRNIFVFLIHSAA